MKKWALRFMSVCVLLSAALFSLTCGESKTPDDSANSLDVKASAVSECGGFGASKMALTDEAAVVDDCAGEMLKWSYDKETSTLLLLNTSVDLNCCGDHGFTTELTDDGVYLVTETDAPLGTSEGTYARCNCECVFDFEISLENIPAEPIAVKLMRAVKSMENPKVNESYSTVWEGTLNLSESSSDNVVVIGGDDASTCEPE
jgi:hypothetical protein